MKHLLLEIQVSDKGQNGEYTLSVAEILEDALAMHLKKCPAGSNERELFVSDNPRIRILTENNPL